MFFLYFLPTINSERPKKGSNGHVSIVRKKGSQDINEDTMAIVDGFLYEIRP